MKPTSKPDAVWWGIEWRNDSAFTGRRRQYLVWEHDVRLYRTRQACREFIEERFGYIRKRPDLKAKPHGWRIPRAVRVEVRRVSR